MPRERNGSEIRGIRSANKDTPYAADESQVAHAVGQSPVLSSYLSTWLLGA